MRPIGKINILSEAGLKKLMKRGDVAMPFRGKESSTDLGGWDRQHAVLQKKETPLQLSTGAGSKQAPQLKGKTPRGKLGLAQSQKRAGVYPGNKGTANPTIRATDATDAKHQAETHRGKNKTPLTKKELNKAGMKTAKKGSFKNLRGSKS